MPFGDKAAIQAPGLRRAPQHLRQHLVDQEGRASIGTHKHRGTVVMVCLEGSARYLEYDWVAHPGDFIYETPGLVHTLVSDHPEGVKLFGWMQGADRVLRRERQVRRDAGRVVVHQPLRDLLPRARHPDQQAALHLTTWRRRRESSAGSRRLGLGDRAEVGGKGGSLGELTRAGIAVPPGFVVQDRARSRNSSRRWSATPRCARESRRCAPGISPPSRHVRANCARACCRRRAPAALVGGAHAAHAALVRARRGRMSRCAPRRPPKTPATRASPGLQDTFLWVGDARDDARSRARLLGQPVFGGIDQLSPRSRHRRERRRHGGGGAVHGRRALPPA